MNILKAAERISKNHLGDVSTFTLKFIRVNGEWKSVDHDYKWNHGFTLLPFECFNDLCQRLSYDGVHTEVIVLVSDEDQGLFHEGFLSAYLIWHSFYKAEYSLGMNVMKKYYGTFYLDPITLFILGKYPKYIWIKPRLIDGKNYENTKLCNL